MEPETRIRQYCEWLAESDRWLFNWGEPLNTLTNLGFILVGAWALWSCARRYGRAPARHADLFILSLLIIAIGCGSWLFHQTQRFVLADVIPIALMLNGYLIVWATRTSGLTVLGRRWPLIPLCVALFMGLSAGIPAIIAQFPSFLSILSTSSYFGALILLFAMGWWSNRRYGDGLLGNAAVLFTISLAFRAADLPTCGLTQGAGLHTVWHLLNATCFALAMLFLFRRVPAVR